MDSVQPVDEVHGGQEQDDQERDHHHEDGEGWGQQTRAQVPQPGQRALLDPRAGRAQAQLAPAAGQRAQGPGGQAGGLRGLSGRVALPRLASVNPVLGADLQREWTSVIFTRHSYYHGEAIPVRGFVPGLGHDSIGVVSVQEGGEHVLLLACADGHSVGNDHGSLLLCDAPDRGKGNCELKSNHKECLRILSIPINLPWWHIQRHWSGKLSSCPSHINVPEAEYRRQRRMLFLAEKSKYSELKILILFYFLSQILLATPWSICRTFSVWFSRVTWPRCQTPPPLPSRFQSRSLRSRSASAGSSVSLGISPPQRYWSEDQHCYWSVGPAFLLSIIWVFSVSGNHILRVYTLKIK